MSLPVAIPILSIEIKRILLSDTEPAPSEGYEIALLKDLGYTKAWIEFKVVTT